MNPSFIAGICVSPYSAWYHQACNDTLHTHVQTARHTTRSGDILLIYWHFPNVRIFAMDNLVCIGLLCSNMCVAEKNHHRHFIYLLPQSSFPHSTDQQNKQNHIFPLKQPKFRIKYFLVTCIKPPKVPNALCGQNLQQFFELITRQIALIFM